MLTPRVFEAGPDGQTIDLGDVEVGPGRTLAGRVTFADRQSSPPGAAISVNPDWSDWRFQTLDEAGRFAVHGIPDDHVVVSLIMTRGGKVQSIEGLPGYHLSRKNGCHDPRFPDQLSGRLDQDINDLTILAEPGDPLSPMGLLKIDPAELADFRDAEAGPITGVPPRALP